MLALVLALLAWSGGAAGWVVIVLGLPRYLFALAALALPWLRRPVPDVMSRKAVCVLQLGTSVPPQAAFLPAPVGDRVLGLGLCGALGLGRGATSGCLSRGCGPGIPHPGRCSCPRSPCPLAPLPLRPLHPPPRPS